MAETRYLSDCPKEIEDELLKTVESVLGRGYAAEYYASIASEFLWVYRAGKESNKTRVPLPIDDLPW